MYFKGKLSKEIKRGVTMSVCSYCGSDYKVGRVNRQGEFYCHKHYMQMKRYGKIKETTVRDVNSYTINEEDSSAEIFVRNRQSETIGSFCIDLEDLEEILKNAWYIHSNGYVGSRRVRTDEKRIYLHRFLMDAQSNEVVDHIDRNPLNNRKNNLRIATQSKNMMNTISPSDNTSGVKGVSFNKKRGRWHAYISIDGRRINLGFFENFKEASKARKDAEIKYHGEYRLNGTKEGGC